MRDDDLRQLLCHADATSPPPQISAGDLAGCVMRQAASQRRVRVRVASLAVLVTFAIIAMLSASYDRRSHVSVVVIPPDKTSPAQTLQSLEADVKFHEQVLASFQRLQRERKIAAVVVVADPFMSDLQQQRDRASLILVDQGDRLYRRFKDRAAAEENYRLAIRLFPDSPAAVTAGERLDELMKVKGNES